MLRKLLAAMAVLICAISVGLSAETTSAPPLVVAHRGLLKHSPENTLANFRACLDLRIGFEVDVFSIQQLEVLAEDLRLAAEQFLVEISRAIAVHIAQRNDVAVLLDRVRVAGPHAAAHRPAGCSSKR